MTKDQDDALILFVCVLTFIMIVLKIHLGVTH